MLNSGAFLCLIFVVLFPTAKILFYVDCLQAQQHTLSGPAKPPPCILPISSFGSFIFELPPALAEQKNRDKSTSLGVTSTANSLQKHTRGGGRRLTHQHFLCTHGLSTCASRHTSLITRFSLLSSLFPPPSQFGGAGFGLELACVEIDVGA